MWQCLWRTSAFLRNLLPVCPIMPCRVHVSIRFVPAGWGRTALCLAVNVWDCIIWNAAQLSETPMWCTTARGLLSPRFVRGMIDWETIFADAGWFHWSGIAAALSQEGADACREALEIADRMGLTISCDLNFRKKLWNYGCTAAEVMQPLVQYSDVIFGAEPEYQEILGIQPVGFRAVDTADVSFESDLPSFEKFGQEVERLVPRCQKVFLELRNSITSNHNVLAAVLYSDGTLKHTGIYDIEHETDRVGAGDAFVGGMIYGLITYPDDDRKALDFALAASALKNTVYGDFNLVTETAAEV